MTTSREKTPYENIQQAILTTARDLGFAEVTATAMIEPDTIIDVRVPVEGIDHDIHMYRVQFNNALGPYKGGVRFHADVDIDEVKMLAITMMLKCSLIGIPLGGAKGGATLNPKEYNEMQIEAVARAWVRTMAEHIGQDKDIPAPDVNTNEQIMAYMLDEFEKIHARSEPGAITGKPLELGGSAGRQKATSQGGVYVLQKMLEYLPVSKNHQSVIIQGFGNVGSHVGVLLQEEGFVVTGLSDVHGGVYLSEGFDVAKVLEDKTRTGKSLNELFSANQKVEKISNAELLVKPCDILIPAALENQITVDNAQDIQAGLILELANNPTSYEADRILDARGITVIPDVLANAGGVTVSYFEWVQNRAQYYWSAEEVDRRLFKQMTEAAEHVFALSQKRALSLRKAGFVLAVGRIGSAMELRGRK